MKATLIPITDEQRVQLCGLFDHAEKVKQDGKPCLIMAQVMPSNMAVFVLDHEKGKAFQRLLGVPENQIGKAGGEVKRETGKAGI